MLLKNSNALTGTKALALVTIISISSCAAAAEHKIDFNSENKAAPIVCPAPLSPRSIALINIAFSKIAYEPAPAVARPLQYIAAPTIQRPSPDILIQRALAANAGVQTIDDDFDAEPNWCGQDHYDLVNPSRSRITICTRWRMVLGTAGTIFWLQHLPKLCI